MKLGQKTLAFAVATLAVTLSAHTAPKRSDTAPNSVVKIAVPKKSQTAESFDFQGEEIATVLRTLAHRAKRNIVIGDSVRGTVSMRLEEKTPDEAIEIICESKSLKREEKGPVLFIWSDDPPPTVTKEESPFSLTPIIEKALTPENIAAAAKLYDALLDIEARPETARKAARIKKALLDALIAEGFSREEALKIVIYSGKFELPEITK